MTPGAPLTLAGYRVGDIAALVGLVVALGGGSALAWSWQSLSDALDARIDDRLEALGVERLAAIEGVAQRNAADVAALVAAVGQLERTAAASAAPPIRFMERGHNVSDGHAGGYVVMRWAIIKERDCGPPRVVGRFINGGGRQHIFERLSIADAHGRGVNLPVDTARVQYVEYAAFMPAKDGVLPGDADAWVVLDYPDCPNVRPIMSPVVRFEITRPPPSNPR